MAQLITIGETMAAFVPPVQGLLRYAERYDIHTAGAESNVAIGVQKLGCSAAWVSRVGTDEFGQYLCNAIRSEGVDCTGVVRDAEHPTGIMFKQCMGGQTSVFYYRKGSAASYLCPVDLDEKMFAEAEIVHMTGITPILSGDCKAMTLHAFDLAHKNQKKVSFDPNIRKKLWGSIDYTELIRGLTLKADIVLIGREEAEVLFGLTEPREICEYLLLKNAETIVAVKDGANGAYVADKTGIKQLPPFPCYCIESVGAGDAFNAGFLAGILQGKTIDICGQMGGIAGAMATETVGDTEGQPDAIRMAAALNSTKIIER